MTNTVENQAVAPALQTTSTVGYYNGYAYSVQIVASKFNVVLTLKPGEYILDRNRRKINDPYFDVFVKNKQLHKETTDKAVPLLTIPVVALTATSTQPSNPVMAITQWTRDAKGQRQPVIPVSPPAASPALPAAVVVSATESVKPMTMDQARKMGLVRKVREVPEDYGVDDTTGLPPSGIPRMKYAIDPTVNRPAPPLPKEMLTLPKDDPNRQTRAQLITGLVQGGKTPVPESVENPFSNSGVVNSSPVIAGSPVTESISEPEPSDFSEPEPVEGPLPAPELSTSAVPVNPSPAVKPALMPLTPKNKFVCMACGAPHKFRSQLHRHAQAQHADRVNAIMAAYPETS